MNISEVAKYHNSVLWGVFLIATMINDLLYTNLMINTMYLATLGFFVFIFAQASLLAVRFSLAFNAVEALSLRLTKTNHAYGRFVPKEFLTILRKDDIIDIALGD